VTTVEDFYRPRHLYQLTAEGEAAERAIDFFESALKKPGELSTTALDDIRSLLRELEPLAMDGNLDGSKVHRVLSQLVSRFEELTSRAHSFVGIHFNSNWTGIRANSNVLKNRSDNLFVHGARTLIINRWN
jgi:Protein of unknown function (DUF2397)